MTNSRASDGHSGQRRFTWLGYLALFLLLAGSAYVLKDPLGGWFGIGGNTPSASVHSHDEARDPKAPLYWTCSMHPSVRRDRPGPCPICGMDLTPVMPSAAAESGEHPSIQVDDARRQRIGVRLGTVARAPTIRRIRAVGRVTWDESRMVDVTLRNGGYVVRLVADESGRLVKRGETLLELYSPELRAAEQEYLLALGSSERARSSSAPERVDYLVNAARERLRLWGVSAKEIARLERERTVSEAIPFASPATGFVIEKNVVVGAAIAPGERLFRIAPLDRVWLEARIYEADLPLVAIGMPVRVSLPYAPGEPVAGKVSYVYPDLDPETRAGRVRVDLPNPDLALKPDMWATVELEVDRGERLQVADSAVIETGTRKLVFVDRGDGRLEPREVRLGLLSDGRYEVLDGLVDGDEVVTSGTFLIAAESRIRDAQGLWGGGHAGH